MGATEAPTLSKRELFRRANLMPYGAKQTKEGCCSCTPGETTILYKKGPGLFQCDVCIALSQAYQNPPPKSASRLVDGSYLLITADQIDFWGNQRLGETSPHIHCHVGTGIIRGVKRDLILNPPSPPWMFISFAKAPLTGAGLQATEDNTMLRFSGKTTLADKTEVHAVNRTQVMQMAAIGMTDREWRTYLIAYANGTPADFKVMETLTEQYPALETLRWIPPVNSPEHNALRLAISTPKGNLMLYQVTVNVQPEFDRYEGHRVAEARSHHAGVPFRWGFNLYGLAEIRSRTQIDGAWEPMPIPTEGSLIRYKMDAHVRRWRVENGTKRRITNVDYMSNLDWWERRARARGLELLNTDFDPITTVVKRLPKPAGPGGRYPARESRPFVMQASRFRGIARIVDADKFEAALANGIGNAKAWGFGFIVFLPIEGRQ